jgi:hypothetical protein
MRQSLVPCCAQIWTQIRKRSRDKKSSILTTRRSSVRQGHRVMGSLPRFSTRTRSDMFFFRRKIRDSPSGCSRCVPGQA